MFVSQCRTVKEYRFALHLVDVLEGVSTLAHDGLGLIGVSNVADDL